MISTDAINIFRKITTVLRENEKVLDEAGIVKNKTDYTIKFFNVPAIKIKNAKRNYIYIKSAYENRLKQYMQLEEIKSMPNWIRFEVTTGEEINSLLSIVSDMYDDMYYQSMDFETFGCCSRYEQCSDELKCVNPDYKLARGCSYKLKLEAGIIYYGKNRNV